MRCPLGDYYIGCKRLNGTVWISAPPESGHLQRERTRGPCQCHIKHQGKTKPEGFRHNPHSIDRCLGLSYVAEREEIPHQKCWQPGYGLLAAKEVEIDLLTTTTNKLQLVSNGTSSYPNPWGVSFTMTPNHPRSLLKATTTPWAWAPQRSKRHSDTSYEKHESSRDPEARNRRPFAHLPNKYERS